MSKRTKVLETKCVGQFGG